MANEKISQMPAAADVFDADLVPIVQAGVNFRCTIGQIRAGGGGGVTDVTAVSPMHSSGGDTPVLSMDEASDITEGYVTLGAQQLGTGMKTVEQLTSLGGYFLDDGTPSDLWRLNNTAGAFVADKPGGVTRSFSMDSTAFNITGTSVVYSVNNFLGVTGTDPVGNEFVGGLIVTIGSGGGLSVAWGAITGTLSAQSDLQTALNARITDPGSATAGALLANDGTNPFWTTGLQVNGSQVILNPVAGFDPFMTLNRQDLTTVHIDTQAGSTWTFTLPPDAGTALQFLQTDGTGVTTWEDAPALVWGAITGTLSDQTDLQAVLDTIIAPGGTHFAVQVNDGAGGLTGSVNVAVVGNVLQVSDGSTGMVEAQGNTSAVHLAVRCLSPVADLVIFDATALEISFFGVATVGQQAANAALTDSTGGTPSATLNAVAGSGADATINDNLASLAARLAEIRALLLAYGLGN